MALTVRIFEIIFTGVADVENVRDSKRLHHGGILRMLPLAKVDLLWEHFVAETFLRNLPTVQTWLGFLIL